MNSAEEKWFFRVAAMLLLATALAKLYSAGGNAKILLAQDQLTHLGFRALMVLAAACEAGVAFFLLRSKNPLRCSLVLLWLTSNFICYRLFNYVLGIHTCPCLGHLTDRLPLPGSLVDVVLKLLLVWWLAGSLRITWRYWGRPRRPAEAFSKLSGQPMNAMR